MEEMTTGLISLLWPLSQKSLCLSLGYFCSCVWRANSSWYFTPASMQGPSPRRVSTGRTHANICKASHWNMKLLDSRRRIVGMIWEVIPHWSHFENFEPAVALALGAYYPDQRGFINRSHEQENWPLWNNRLNSERYVQLNFHQALMDQKFQITQQNMPNSFKKCQTILQADGCRFWIIRIMAKIEPRRELLHIRK